MASIRTHTKKDGSQSFYVIWRDPDTGKQTSLPSPSAQQAETLMKLLNANGQRLSVVEKALADTKIVEASVTLNAVFQRHIDALTRANDRTVADYKRIWRDHGIEGGMGLKAVDQVDDEDVGTWMKKQLETRAHKTVANTGGLLSSVFKTAVRRGLAPSNPCDLVRMPAENATKRKIVPLSVDEFWQVHDFIVPRHRLMVRTLVSSGMRYSEVTALEVSTLREGLQGKVPVIPIVRAWKEKKNRGSFDLGEPKAGSIRDVSIQPDLAAELLEHMKNMPSHGLVFPNKNGTQLRNTTFHQAGWQDAITAAKKAGLTKTPRPHDLRHTHASWLISEGMSLYDISKRLGHKSTAVTEQIYGHMMPKALTVGAALIGDLMKR